MFKKRKLLFQIGLVVSIVFLLIMVLMELYVFNKNTTLFLSAKNEMIDQDLQYTRDSVDNRLCTEIIQYWYDHPESATYIFTDEEFHKLYEEGHYMFVQNYVYDDESFSKLDKDLRKLIAKEQFMDIGMALYSSAYARGYNDMYCLQLADNDQAIVINDCYDYAFYDVNVASMTDAMKEFEREHRDHHVYKQIINFDTESVPGLDTAIAEHSNKAVYKKELRPGTGKVYYVGYLPIYDRNDNFVYLLCAEYDWTEVYSSMLKEYSVNMIFNTLFGLIISAGITLLALNFVAVRPLNKVTSAINLYKTTKKSEDVEYHLEGLKSKNEIGFLADSLLELTKEIDEYTEKNINLATETAKVKTELDLAASIQGQSLTKVFPKSGIYEAYASMTPAKEVGGDFYDIFDIDDSHVGFVIADVSGKGMPAALLMMAAMTSIRNYSMSGAKPSEIISRVNEDLVNRNIMDMFVTVWLGILDKTTGMLITSNAGHEYPALNTSGKYEMFRDRHGLVCGGMSGTKYRDHEIQLKNGDSVFVYTDGVPEATNGETQLFGEARMLEALNSNPKASPSELLSNVKKTVDEFVGDAEQFDDLTMMCIKINDLKMNK